VGAGAGGFANAAAQFENALARPGAARGGQTVYLLQAEDRLKPISIRTGITDGRFTEVLDASLQPGDQVVVGQATSKVDTSTRPPGGRMF
jgi:HlyD family secretion protein